MRDPKPIPNGASTKDTIRGILLMIFAMAGFALTDALLKTLTGHLPIAQVIFTLGLGGTLIFATAVRISGQALFTREWISPIVMLRNLAEAIATTTMVMALSLVSLSNVSAILQANPLFVTMGAALILGETVGWRRWMAIAAGFAGMLLILRPTHQGLDWGVLLAVVAMLMLALRDLSTRLAPPTLSTMQLATYAFVTLTLTGLIMMPMGPVPVWPDGPRLGLSVAAVVSASLGYYAITAAMRVGHVAAVTPFRYTRLVFAMAIGILLLGERPDALTLLGAAIIIASGLYSFNRERKRRSAEKL